MRPRMSYETRMKNIYAERFLLCESKEVFTQSHRCIQRAFRIRIGVFTLEGGTMGNQHETACAQQMEVIYVS